jgi:hypothetical protein
MKVLAMVALVGLRFVNIDRPSQTLNPAASPAITTHTIGLLSLRKHPESLVDGRLIEADLRRC